MKENQQFEWKETWRDELLRWVCGFANAGGGALHIGRNDRGKVVGLPDSAKLLEEIPNKIRDLLGILVAVNAREENGLPGWRSSSIPIPIRSVIAGTIFSAAAAPIRS